jgi:hypothetical protein
VRSYDSFQRMGKPTPIDKMTLQPQVMVDHFEKWALDFIGLMNPLSKGKICILVCINYVTKWMEAKSLSRGIEESVVNFLFEDIFVRFGVPKGIFSDKGAQFTSNLLGKLLKNTRSNTISPHLSSTSRWSCRIYKQSFRINHDKDNPTP